MATLTVCRICLNTDVQHVVKNLQLQETYEKLTKIPTDKRPPGLCYICFAQLKTSHRFMLKCLKAEQLLTQMLDQMLTNEDGVLDRTLIDRSALKQLSTSPVEQISIGSTIQNGEIIGLERQIKYEVDVKLEEHSSIELSETANSIDSEPEDEHSSSDPEDNIPLNNIETATEQEEVRISKKRRNGLNKAGSFAKKPKLRPEVYKSTEDKNICYTNAVIARNQASTPERIADTKNPVSNDDIKINSKKDAGKNYMCQQNVCKQGLIKREQIHTGEKPYVCNVCEKGFTYKSRLVNHGRIHTGERPYVCNVCTKGFTTKGHLDLHERIHTGEKPYVCNVCKKAYTTKGHLVNHERIHTGEKPYVCNVCKKSFTNMSSLVDHGRIHTGERPYVCNVCEKDFTNMSNLVTHGRIHTGERPYVCNVCKKDFTNMSNLLNHGRIHTGERPHVCNVCKKGFTNMSNLVNHGRIHTGERPYVCNVCKKDFTNMSNLVNHKRIHTGEKPYVCNVCKKNFTNVSNLINHERIHTGDRPYVCNVCKKCFTNMSNLVRHERTHTV